MMHLQLSAGDENSFPRVGHTSSKDCTEIVQPGGWHQNVYFLGRDEIGWIWPGWCVWRRRRRPECWSNVVTSRVVSSVPGTEARWARCGKSQVWSQRTLVLCRHQVGTGSVWQHSPIHRCAIQDQAPPLGYCFNQGSVEWGQLGC